MKTTISVLKFSQRTLATVTIAIVGVFSISLAQAGYILTLQQVGPNVVATGSGPLDLTGLSFVDTDTVGAGITPQFALAGAGPVSFPLADGYQSTTGPFAGPTNFGPGAAVGPDSGSGDLVAIFPYVFGNGFLFVPVGYASNNSLSDSMIFNNQTLSSLGVTPGTYKWTWGTGANQRFTLTGPDSGSTFGLLLLSFAALLGANRFSSLRLA